MPAVTATTSSSIVSAVPLRTISVPGAGSTIGTISLTPPLGSPSNTVRSLTPGGRSTNGAALPLATPQIPANPSLGSIKPVTRNLAVQIDPTMTVVPTPNTSAVLRVRQ